MQSVAAIQARPAAVAVRPARRQSVRVMAASAGQEVRTFVLGNLLTELIFFICLRTWFGTRNSYALMRSALTFVLEDVPEYFEP